jgi:hypothetical protein
MDTIYTCFDFNFDCNLILTVEAALCMNECSRSLIVAPNTVSVCVSVL